MKSTVQQNVTASSEMAETKVSLKTSLSYASGNFGMNLFYMIISSYLLYFYTDVFGITAAAAGTLFLVTRIFDGVTDIGAGFVVDATKSKHGRYRVYLLYGAIPMAISGVLCFTVPNFGDTGMLVYAYTTYIFFGLMYTVINIPYSSMLASITQDYNQRSSISSVKVLFGTVATLVATSATLPFVQLFDSEAQGFLMITSIFGIVCIISIYITFFGTKNVGQQAGADTAGAAKENKVSFATRLKVIGKNGPLALVLIFCLVNSTAFTIQSGAMLFFFKYNIGNAGLFAIYSLVNLSIVSLFVLLSPIFTKWLGKRNQGILSQIIAAAGMIGLFFLHSSLFQIFFFTVIFSIGTGLSRPFDLGNGTRFRRVREWKTGVNSAGLVYSTFIFTQKLAAALGGALSGIILGATGYVANATQTTGALQGILISVTIVPIIAYVIGIIVLLFYKLDGNKYEEILAQIKARKA